MCSMSKVSKGHPRNFSGVSAEDNGVTPVPGMPSLGAIDLEKLIYEKFKDALGEPLQDEPEKNIEESTELKKPEDFDLDRFSTVASETIEEGIVELFRAYFGSFAVSGSTYYMEYNQSLFRWKPGTTEWVDTGLVDAAVSPDAWQDLEDQGSIDFKIAVSGETVYVGKRDGHLFQSFNEGDAWNDVTTTLPFSVNQFKAVAFAGPTLYAATDKGITYSRRWYSLAYGDRSGRRTACHRKNGSGWYNGIRCNSTTGISIESRFREMGTGYTRGAEHCHLPCCGW